MGIPLFAREVKTKLGVAIIADAAIGPFPQCHHMSTIERLTNEGVASYEVMWDKIATFYEKNCWYDLSGERLRALLEKIAKEGGYGLHGLPLGQPTSAEVASAARRWDNYGWLNYEQRRAGKVRTLKKVTRYTLMIGSLVGIPSFFDVE